MKQKKKPYNFYPKREKRTGDFSFTELKFFRETDNKNFFKKLFAIFQKFREIDNQFADFEIFSQRFSEKIS